MMFEKFKDEPTRLRKVVAELRENAQTTSMPGYANQLLDAAEALEKYAAKLEESV